MQRDGEKVKRSQDEAPEVAGMFVLLSVGRERGIAQFGVSCTAASQEGRLVCVCTGMGMEPEANWRQNSRMFPRHINKKSEQPQLLLAAFKKQLFSNS